MVNPNHSAPRLALFTPDRVQACPVPDDELTGLRQTTVKPIAIGAETVMIEDQFRDESDPHRLLQERWTGETRFKLKEKNVRRTVRAPTRGKKRKRRSRIRKLILVLPLRRKMVKLSRVKCFHQFPTVN